MALKIISLPVDESACGYYRIRKPLEGLQKYTEHDTYIIDTSKDDVTELMKAMPSVDVIFMRPGAEQGLMQIQNLFKDKVKSPLKAKIVLDIDDNVDIISPYSQFYSNYGLEEYKHGDKYIWKDGERGFSIQTNLARMSYLKWGMKIADLITVTTDKLAEHALEYNKNVYVNDNTLDFNHWYRLNNKINKPLRVVWQGSPSHYEDWYAIKEPLNKLMDEFDFEMIMLGSQYQGIFDEKHRSRVKALPWVNFQAHSYRMMSLQADIGIIPLADLPFNHYKSSIKFYENAAMGLPSVVSNILPYSKSIKHGKTAMGYNSPDEFYDSMKKLLENKGLRSNIANAAYIWVRENKSLELESKKLAERLEQLCKS